MDNIFSVGAIGAAVHAAKHLVEHDERRVREDRFHLAGEHDQSRQSARRIEPRKMLSAENGRFPSDRSVARAMNPLLRIWPNAQASDELQTLDDANQVLLRRRFRPITQPGECRAISTVAEKEFRAFSLLAPCCAPKCWRSSLAENSKISIWGRTAARLNPRNTTGRRPNRP